MDKIFVEPYFQPANSRYFLANGESWVENNQQFRQAQKYHFYRCAMDFIVENDLAGSFFEFGVHRARTFSMVMSLDDFYASNKGPTGGQLRPQKGGGYLYEYVALDSFAGFPEDTQVPTHPMYKGGHVSTSDSEFIHLLEKYGQSVDRVTLVKGFYNESLTQDLGAKFRNTNTKCSLVTLDCNLYESYRDALAFVDEFLQPGCIVYLDDYNTYRGQPAQGPKKAWVEYVKRSIWKFEPFLTVGWAGMSYICCK